MNDDRMLNVDYTTLKYRIGRELGLPEDEGRWFDGQRRDVDEVIREGFRLFYTPPQVDQFPPHEWSFKKPTRTIRTVQGQRWYDLPADFSLLDAAASVACTDASNGYLPLAIVSSSLLAEYATAEVASEGIPLRVATRQKNSDGSSPQQWEIGFDPTPDGEYEFAYIYNATPYMVSTERPYPLGGAEHGQCILLACLAAAELFEFGQRGDAHQAFLEKLKSDIAHDARRAPATLGYGGVSRRGGWRERFGFPRQSGWSNNSVTYRGQSYL